MDGSASDISSERFQISDGSDGSSSELDDIGPFQDTIIINQLPQNVSPERLLLLFIKYWRFPNPLWYKSTEFIVGKADVTARITFRKKSDALQIWEDFQKEQIYYDDQLMMMTLASDDASPIEHLPDLPLQKIFLNLDSITDKFNVELVCKRWRDQGRVCWSSITAVFSSKNRDNVNCCSYRNIYRNHRKDWSIETWRVILSRTGPSLKYVTLCLHLEADVDFLSCVAKNCKNLRGLIIHDLPSDKLSDFRELWAPLVRQIIRQNRKLKQICFFSKEGLFDVDFFEELPDDVEEIAYLSDYNGINCAWPSSLALSRFTNLRVLHLHEFENLNDYRLLDGVANLERLGLHVYDMPESIVSCILKNNRSLKYLNLRTDVMLSEECLKNIESMMNLQVLFIYTVFTFPPDFFKSLSTRLKGLGIINTSLSDDKLEEFFKSAESIQKVLFSGFTDVPSQAARIGRDWSIRTGKPLQMVLNDSSYFMNGTPHLYPLDCSELFADNWKMWVWGVELLD